MFKIDVIEPFLSFSGGTAVNLNAPLSREGLRFETFPQPSQDEYERKLQEIMKLTGVLSIGNGSKF